MKQAWIILFKHGRVKDWMEFHGTEAEAHQMARETTRDFGLDAFRLIRDPWSGWGPPPWTRQRADAP